MIDKATFILKTSKRLFNSSERSMSETQWEQICRFMLPNQLTNMKQVEYNTPGRVTTNGLYTSVGSTANRDLSSAVRDLADPSERPILRFVDSVLNDNYEAVRWLDQCSYVVQNFYGESNLDSEISKAYSMLTALGNMAILHEQKTDAHTGKFAGFKFKALHLSELVWLENSDGYVDTIFRKVKLTAKQASEKFEEHLLSDVIKNDLQNGDWDKTHDFIHGIYPRQTGSNKPKGIMTYADMPFESCYVDVKSKAVVKEEGYNEFPLYFVRWETMPGETIGRGPGHIALPDLASLNRFMELAIKAYGDSVEPAWLVSQANQMGDLDIRPNKLNVVVDIDGIRPLKEASDFVKLDYAKKDFIDSIQKVFYLDKILLPPRNETGEMSAYEVSQRLEQVHKVMGPVAGRLYSELLIPLNIRAFSILLREKLFPPVPDVLKKSGINIKVDFVSPIVRSQKMRDGTALQSWFNVLAQWAQVVPSVMDNFKSDDAAVTVGRTLGVPEVDIATSKEIAEVRQQRAQAQQQQQQIENQVKAADIQAKQSKAGR